MIENIFVICGYGTCDIGKGWLTSAIAGCLDNVLVVKLDPFLNNAFPEDSGVNIKGKYVSDDFANYAQSNFEIFPEANIINGMVLSDLKQLDNVKELSRGCLKKLTFADIAEVFSKRLCNLLTLKKNIKHIIIEIGGSFNDREHIWVPDALKNFGNIIGKIPEIVLLTYFEYTEAGYKIKTQLLRNMLRNAPSFYGLPIKACFVRRRYLPDRISEEEIIREMFNVSFETQFPVNKLIIEKNYNSIEELKQFVAGTGIFGQKQKNAFVSSCLLGIRCRFSGKGKTLLTEHYKELIKYNVFSCCPEVLSGLGIPRKPCEIVGGDGFDVLNGNAFVINKDGKDISTELLSGCRNALELVRENEVTKFYLCNKSPSCSSEYIYDGTFSGKLIKGDGVFSALLKKNGYRNIVSVSTAPSV